MGKKRTAARRAAAAATAIAACPASPSIVTAVLDDPAVTATALDFEREQAPTQPPREAHEASSCLTAHTPPTASDSLDPTTHNASVPCNNTTQSQATGIDPNERTTASDPRDLRSHTSLAALNTHIAVANDIAAFPSNRAYPRAAIDERKNEVRARGEDPYHATGEHSHDAPHAAPPPFDDTPPAPNAAQSPPRNVSAVAEQPDGPGHNVHAPFFTPTGPTATLAALVACIPIHGPPDVFLTCHAHIDPRPDASYDITDTPTSPEPKPNAREPIQRRATAIDEIDEDLLARIRGDAVERGWQAGWDEGEMHGRASAYQEGYKAARAEVSTSTSAVDISTPHDVPDTTPSAPHAPHDGPAHTFNNVQTPAPGIEPGTPQTAAANDLYHDHRPRLARSDEELEPAFLNALVEQGWRRGMKEGRREARKESREESRMEGREEGYREGHEDGRKEGLESAEASRKEGREEGFREGLEAGKKLGVLEGQEQGYKDGRVAGLKTGRALVLAEVRDVSLVSTAVQTAALPCSSPRADVAAQNGPIITCTNTSLPTGSASGCTTSIPTPADSGEPVNHSAVTVTTDDAPSVPFSWADDADALPISPVSTPSPPPRDLSALRSDSVVRPFGSLQRRARRSHRHSVRAPQSRWSRSPAASSSSWRSSSSFWRSSSSSWRSSTHHVSDLEWERDPRLSELSHVLQGLGWVRLSVA